MDQKEREIRVQAVTETLRQLAGWGDEDRSTSELEALATTVETYALNDDGLCCLMCQEVHCDDGCPLDGVRPAP